MIGVWLPFHFGRYFNHSPDCFSPRRQIGLGTTPIIHSPQKGLRDSHLKGVKIAANSAQVTRTREAHLEHEQAKAELKGLVPEDAKEAIGHGVRAKRSKSGAISFDLLTTAIEEAGHAAR